MNYHEEDKCPKCLSTEIGQGVLKGPASMFPKGKSFGGSAILSFICTKCGYIISSYVQKPENFKGS
jgi:predicted nucleic-acid-binding Zn-ribbon protein